MDLSKARIGLALSGGGIRASIFHLGMLQYLAEVGLFERISNISSVSGASLVMGAIFAANGNKWPNSHEFLNHVQPRVRRIILDNNIQASALRRLPFSPWYWRNRVKLLAKVLEEKWGINGNLQALPRKPFWEINCTTFETGRNFRFRRDYMGDPLIGYVRSPELPISHMIAASSAFPVLIGPYVLETGGMDWIRPKPGGSFANAKKVVQPPQINVDDHYTLWDGGVYDNLGLDALYRVGGGFEREMDSTIDFLIVSNAGAPIGHQVRKGHLSPANLKRLLDIAVNQVDVLRSQQVYSEIISAGKGLYLKIGLSAGQVAQILGVPQDTYTPLVKGYLSTADTTRVRDYPTTLNSPSAENFELIFRHGYENIKCAVLFSPWRGAGKNLVTFS